MNTQLEKTKILEVVAAVLQKPDGSFLLAQRPEGKVYAGYWEFPGGKIEPGETPYHALVRELREELGITVTTAYHWVTRVFTYSHATVRLNFFRVTAWSGELHPHEGQQFSWQQASHSNPPQPPFFKGGSANAAALGNSFPPFEKGGRRGDFAHSITVAPVLPANAPILRALQLPSLYAISNAAELGSDEFLQRLQQALGNGLRLVQMREKNLPRAALRELSLRVLELAHAHGALVLINGDIELALEIGADGVHLNSAQLAALSTRPDLEWCGASCHSVDELQLAVEMGLDFAVLSPVLPTQSHPGAAHLGWQAFAAIAADSAIPVYALGGLSQEDMETAWQHGAHGIALLRQAW